MFESLEKEDIYWLAGLYEGEGCLHIKYTGAQVQGVLTVVSTDKDILDKLISIFPLFKITGKPRVQEHRKDQWTIWLRKGDYIYAFCCMVYPMLGKRRQEKMEEFFKLYKEDRIKRRAMYDKGQTCKTCPKLLVTYDATKGYCGSCYMREHRKNKQNNLKAPQSIRIEGFSLLEVLVAIFIFSIVLLETSALAVTIIRGNKFANNLTTATTLAEYKIGVIEGQGFNGLSSVNTDIVEDYKSISDYPSYKSVTSIYVDNPASGMKLVAVTVYWDSDAHSIVLKTIFAE